MRESCGIFGIYNYNKKNVVYDIYLGLMALHHRGQESAGISLCRGSRIKTEKVYGLVNERLLEKMEKFNSKIGIGHVRYSTAGRSTLVDAQPISKKSLSIAHNGNLVNNVLLRQQLKKDGIKLRTRNDSELILSLLTIEKERTGDIFEAIKNSLEKLEGAFSLSLLTNDGKVIAIRDPYGFRPLCEGEAEGVIAFSSESIALDINNINLSRDIQPGEMAIVDDNGIERKRYASYNRRAHCMFEYVYFSRPDSIIEGRSVYRVRYKLGVNLAKTYDNDADVIIPVPDTSRTAAEGLSHESGIPVTEGLIKNRYVQRTFIMPRQKERDGAVRIKLNPLKTVLSGKRVLLVDDSIVRGTTLRNIISMIRRSGAKEVHVRVTCPPIISPCFYGIDIAFHKELVACDKTLEEIRRSFIADTLGYQKIEGLVDAIGLPKEDLCLGCLTGKYPTPLAQELSDKLKCRVTSKKTRYWEEG